VTAKISPVGFQPATSGTAQLGSGLEARGGGEGNGRDPPGGFIPAAPESRARGTKVKSAGFPSGEVDRTGSPAGGGGGRDGATEEEEDARGMDDEIRGRRIADSRGDGPRERRRKHDEERGGEPGVAPATEGWRGESRGEWRLWLALA